MWSRPVNAKPPALGPAPTHHPAPVAVSQDSHGNEGIHLLPDTHWALRPSPAPRTMAPSASACHLLDFPREGGERVEEKSPFLPAPSPICPLVLGVRHGESAQVLDSPRPSAVCPLSFLICKMEAMYLGHGVAGGIPWGMAPGSVGYGQRRVRPMTKCQESLHPCQDASPPQPFRVALLESHLQKRTLRPREDGPCAQSTTVPKASEPWLESRCASPQSLKS